VVDVADIEDQVLVDAINEYNLTLPHPDSVLDEVIEDYDPQLYYRLTAMEAFTYEHSEQPAESQMGATSGIAGVEQYQPFWQDYSDALIGYIAHAPLSKQRVKDMITALYCYMSVNSSRGIGSQEQIDRGNAKLIFTINDHYDHIKDLPIDAYDDFEPGDEMAEPPTEGGASTITEDIDRVSEAWDIDASEVDSLIDTYSDIVSDAVLQVTFSNPEPPESEGLTRRQAWDKIFDELNWQWYIEHFNSTVPIPDRPE